MQYSFILRTSALTICLFLFVGMIITFWVGRLVRRRLRMSQGEAKGGIGMIQSSLFALLGLILAFTFGMSGNRYDQMRSVVTEESNCIGTAILRSDLYSDSVREIFRSDFRQYLQARISLYEDVSDTGKIKSQMRGMDSAGKHLWKLAMDQSKLPNMLIPSNQMIPALNSLFDIAEKRDIVLRQSIPDVIIYMLLILTLASSFVAGLNTGRISKNDVLMVLCFALFTSLIILITLDIGRPMRGLIKTNIHEQAIRDNKKYLD